ncbi:hypothetical protein GCM10010313_52230 [Streptomyces violarus]|uniref:Uncharacterized protein n=1 Tax=Streptomyces violarus TaxID=67380 RepID=A0A7W4ZT50_9ACTN|nr:MULTISPECIES: hypothetical protein [Streptomyces]MBB3078205.1 hypothetical protein [Streptomyces violarus]WRT99644.1 hypothetical protein VJ737_18945 [Streptomyces sp. CGMCC 4.1772]GHD20165.1 hypothetical protein GCM10010313_52230 [Streptomyces violarus]
MRTFIGHQQAVTTDEFVELALGTPIELWLGVEGETEEERAAREDAARDILADHPGLADDVARIAAEVIDMNPELFDVVPLPRPGRRRATRKAVAA